MRLFRILWQYWKTKQLTFKSREALELYQQQQFLQFKTKVLSKSPYFKKFIDLPLSA